MYGKLIGYSWPGEPFVTVYTMTVGVLSAVMGYLLCCETPDNREGVEGKEGMAMMDLKTFVAESLKQIAQGIKDAQAFGQVFLIQNDAHARLQAPPMIAATPCPQDSRKILLAFSNQ